ncbi:hypothetical protein BOX15_Mlig007630g2, partial [Macrostomum lignano]
TGMLRSVLLLLLCQFLLLVEICRTSAAAQASKEESVSQSAPSLLQVTLLYRHGERTPVHTFPLDPYKQLFRPYGSEQLLEEGVRQHFELGKYLRRRYWSLLPRRFNVTRMHVRSTDTDRTIMSAQANLAGLFPEQCSAAVDGAAQLPACYPVPIHTVPKPTDQLLKMSSPCPAYTRHWREFKLRPDGPYASAGRRFTWLSERARVGTGWRQGEPLGISELWKIADPIAVWRSLGLKLPDWVDRDVIAGLEELRHLKFAWKFSEPKLYGSRIGALMARLIGDMEARLAGRSNKILQVYSAHDSTVSAFLSAFGVFNNLQPPLAACAMLELYSDGEVRLFYRNATTTTNSSLSADPPLPMLIPFCQKPCLLSQLAKQMRKRGAHSDSGESMCELATDSSVSKTTVTTDSSSNAIFIVLFGLILCLAIALVITCWLWNKERQLRLECDSNMFANHISKTKDC